MKKLCILILLLLIPCLLFVGCTTNGPSELVRENHFSMWETKDKSVVLYIADGDTGYCTVTTALGEYNLFCVFYDDCIVFYDADSMYYADTSSLGTWYFGGIMMRNSSGEYDSFAVSKGGDSLMGQSRLVFNRVAVNLDEDDIPYSEYPVDEPYCYPMTKWESDDGRIVLYAGEDGRGYGELISETGSVYVYCVLSSDIDKYVSGDVFVSSFRCFDTESYRSLESWTVGVGEELFPRQTTYFDESCRFEFTAVETYESEAELLAATVLDNE